eukprot:NODE_121_length_17861_cov_0.498480.p14 type:complete len:143 gc:universal NODE_121_length_17861_cov_0.498480:2755-3183(+)
MYDFLKQNSSYIFQHLFYGLFIDEIEFFLSLVCLILSSRSLAFSRFCCKSACLFCSARSIFELSSFSRWFLSCLSFNGAGAADLTVNGGNFFFPWSVALSSSGISKAVDGATVFVACTSGLTCFPVFFEFEFFSWELVQPIF